MTTAGSQKRNDSQKESAGHGRMPWNTIGIVLTLFGTLLGVLTYIGVGSRPFGEASLEIVACLLAVIAFWRGVEVRRQQRLDRWLVRLAVALFVTLAVLPAVVHLSDSTQIRTLQQEKARLESENGEIQRQLTANTSVPPVSATVPLTTRVTATSTTNSTSAQSPPTYLSDLEAVEGEPKIGEQTVNAKTYRHSVALLVDACGPDQAGFNLDRDHRHFRAVIGLTDATRSLVIVRFQISIDGKRLATYDLKVGETKRLDLDVTGGLRLLLYGERIDDAFDCMTEGEEAVWADAQVS